MAALQENFAVYVFIRSIRIREMNANVSQRERPQHGIANGVQQHIRITVPFGALVYGVFLHPRSKDPFLLPSGENLSQSQS